VDSAAKPSQAGPGSNECGREKVLGMLVKVLTFIRFSDRLSETDGDWKFMRRCDGH
jgi:hypothetical protein